MTRLLPSLLLLAGCYQLPGGVTALDAQERLEVERARELWLAEGLPDPRRCEPLRVWWPASDEVVRRECWRPVHACYVTLPEGLGPFLEHVPVAVVHEDQPRHSWRHELGHHWQRCLGKREDHDPAFRRWLDAVEGRE